MKPQRTKGFPQYRDTRNQRPSLITVVMVGQFPPPVHGQSLAIERLSKADWPDIRIIPVPMNFSEHVREVGRPGLRKIFRLITLRQELTSVLKTNAPSILYYPPAPPKWVPFLRDCFLLGSARKHAQVTLFHFHANGLGEFVNQTALRKLLGGNLYHADFGIQAGTSCPPDASQLQAKDIRFIPSGVPDPGIRGMGSAPGSTDTLRILVVGHLSKAKGTDLLAGIANKVQGNCRFDIVGDWANSREKRKYASRLNHTNLHFHGPLFGKKKWAFFDRAHVLLFPSRSEAQGLVAVEAMACRLPVIASDIPGIRDVISHDLHGLLVPPGDEEQFASALDRIRYEPLWSRLGTAARERYETTYRLDFIFEQWRKLFQEAASKM